VHDSHQTGSGTSDRFDIREATMSGPMPSVLVVDHNALRAEDREIYRELQSVHGFEVSVITPREWREQFGHVVCDPESSSLRVIPSPVLFMGKTHRVVYGALASAMRSLQPDLLWVNSEPEGFAALQAALLCSLRSNAPGLVFETWRNIPYGEPGVPFPVRWSWLCKAIESFVLSRSAHGVTHSPGGSAIFHARGFDRILEVPPWVDQRVFSPPDGVTAPARERSSGFTVGFVGRFVPEKGVLVLLDAVEASGVQTDVVLMGDGPQRAWIESHAASMGPSSRVSILPPRPHPDVAKVMRTLDVLVLPSVERPGWSEQFGRVIIEAMACGVPVVGSSSGAIPKVIGGAGILFPSGNVADLAATLSRLHEHPDERLRLSAAGLERVAAEYSVAPVARKYADLLVELASRSRHR